ncbi:type III pantothenate kinase [Candidatus Nitrotoga sp. 1052]|uniref:type III pantothenate kinase n=1 Tax=Candidatus Nitrotoga sp. 1052 TaxID=2886964 RepID=UPI001EF501AA|nr:type III pantothenate kinase [Candidatus Nitrotoga sp. 1052]CAH1077713.1 Type III pantothenate kinase [Candidatus Nitrotoga sp. 1052]
MKMLLIDAGNSRVKWAIVEGGKWLQQNVLENTHAPALNMAFSELPPPDRILISNVAGENMAQQLSTACAAWHCPIEFIVAQVTQCGVLNSYEHPAQLGSDRWAALIAAWHQERASCLVVNCGTATTVDALSAEGEFLGGLILPGVDMMQSSLAAGAAQLVQTEGVWREFPRNTADATFSGSIQATIGAIRLQFEALAVRGGVRCLLSGGAADNVQSRLKLPLVRVDNLVLRGLQIIGQENLS